MLQILQKMPAFLVGRRKIDQTVSCSGNSLKCKTFPSTNQIVWNVYKDKKVGIIVKYLFTA